MAVAGKNEAVSRFERVAVVLSGGGALGAYQAGALAAMEMVGWQPNFLAATSTGAFNAAIAAGAAPRERAARLRNFWSRIGGLAETPVRRGLASRIVRRLAARPAAAAPVRALVEELVDFSRINSGVVRLSLGAVHLPTGAETVFDNDRHVLTIDHVMASAALPAGLPPVSIGDELYGSAEIASAIALPRLFDGIAPADTLCFVVDCFDPTVPGTPGLSRSGQDIAAYRRWHDLRWMLGKIGDRLPAALLRDPDVRRCLAHGSRATMNLVHLVHESDAGDLRRKLGDFSDEAISRRWRAGERAMVASLAQPSWLAPPPDRIGVVVHELREAPAQRRDR
ncbi:MAG: Patatin [Rhodospirillales bacterium]|nr:Patatin [Rhodospirillales bacterium]